MNTKVEIKVRKKKLKKGTLSESFVKTLEEEKRLLKEVKAGPKKDVHASRSFREMIARQKIGRNERKPTEIGAFEVGQCRTLVLPWKRPVSHASRSPNRRAAADRGNLEAAKTSTGGDAPSRRRRSSARQVARATAHISHMEGMEGHARAADIRSRL